MATLAAGGRITMELVDEEIERLKIAWQRTEDSGHFDLDKLIGPKQAQHIDLFDRLQLQQVLRICGESQSLSEAGRVLFDCSRLNKATSNDAYRLRKFLARFGLSWQQLNLSRKS